MSSFRRNDTFTHTETDVTGDKVGDTAQVRADHGWFYVAVRPRGHRTWSTVRLPLAQFRTLCARGVEIADVTPVTGEGA